MGIAWAGQSIRTPSSGLAALVARLTGGADPVEAERRVIEHVARVFTYGHEEERFTDGHPDVPALACGLIQGACFDIHTYAVAARTGAGLSAIYLAGVFVPTGQDSIADMHCWFAARAGDRAEQWDLSHDIIAGVSPVPGFGTIKGRRQLLSSGRGLTFRIGSNALVEVSHFAVPTRAESGERLSAICVLS